MLDYDKIIIGAGLYGLYSAEYCGRKGQKVLVIECDEGPFMRATYINQARVHQGYHYPRSLATAVKSAGYFRRFNEDYGFCINSEFRQVYAISSAYSWTDGKQFESFCEAAGIPCEELNPGDYFKDGMCDGAFLTNEYTYDAKILCDYLTDKVAEYDNVTVKYGTTIEAIEKDEESYLIRTDAGEEYRTTFILNATYAGSNQILKKAGYEPFKIKYELCEIILCKACDKLTDCGITVMDGPFFSIMPFGKTGFHSLTAVTFTPHATSYEETPTFDCQQNAGGYCNPDKLGNCNACKAKPKTAFPYMSGLAHKYLKDEYGFEYDSSLYSMKPILVSSEIDDSRPTIIKVHSDKPTFVSVLSGKINTVYDLDEILQQ